MYHFENVADAEILLLRRLTCKILTSYQFHKYWSLKSDCFWKWVICAWVWKKIRKFYQNLIRYTKVTKRCTYWECVCLPLPLNSLKPKNREKVNIIFFVVFQYIFSQITSFFLTLAVCLEFTYINLCCIRDGHVALISTYVSSCYTYV